MARRGLSIIIVPHDKGQARTMRISYRRLKVVLTVVTTALFLVAGALGHYSLLLKKVGEMEELRTENLSLREKISMVEVLKLKLESYEEYVERINTILGVGSRGKTTKVFGEGPEQRGASAGKEVEVIPINEDQAIFIPSLEGEVPSDWPLTRRGFVTRGYAEGADFHPGIDIAVPENTPVRATASGLVLDLGWDKVYGNFVELRHGEGYTTLYCHNSRLIVERGQWVRKGEIVSFSGNTGRSTAPHLHYEVRCKGVAVDPQPYLLGYRQESRIEG